MGVILYSSPLKIMNPKIPKKIRLDSSLYCNPSWIYSITLVADFKKQYFLKHKLNMEVIECLKLQREKLGCKVFVYCLMPEHLHLLATPVSVKNLVINFVNQFKGRSTAIAWKYGIKGSLWQRRWYDHILRKQEDICKMGEYILDNPVRRTLVKNRYEYPYGGCLDEFTL